LQLAVVGMQVRDEDVPWVEIEICPFAKVEQQPAIGRSMVRFRIKYG
jgi:hypothetical protein